MANSTGVNKTEAPTSGKTEENLNDNDGLTPYEVNFVTLLHQYYGLHGKVLTVETAQSEYFFEEDEFKELIGNPKIVDALIERGVFRASAKVIKPVKADELEKLDDKPDWTDSILEPMQLVVANAMLDLVDTRSQKKKLQDLGISTAKFNIWIKDPKFQAYLKKRAEDMLGENQHEAHLSLLDKVRMGDIKALELYYEMTGQYTRASASGNGGSNQVIEFNNLLVKILEIINDEVDDADTAMKIAERFKSLIGAKAMADQLMDVDEPILMPTVKENRELSPELKSLLTTGGDEYIDGDA